MAIDPDGHRATFSTRDAEDIVLANILDVGVGLRGTDLNTYIEVRYGDVTSPGVVFLRDERFLHFRNLLTGSNVRIARILTAGIPRAGS